MFNRVRDSLLYPKEILKYRKDSMFFVLFYLFFFALLLSTRTAIDVLKYDGMSNIYKDNIQETMTIVENDCYISDSELFCDSELTILLFEDVLFKVYLDSNELIDSNNYDSGEYAIIIHEKSVFVTIYGMNNVQFLISEMPEELHNLDFKDQTLDENLFYTTLFTGIDKLIVSYKGIWGTLFVLSEFLLYMTFYLLFISISSLFLRNRYKFFTFKEAFTITTYSSTGLFIVLTFFIMLELDIIYLIIFILISFRQSGILNREIQNQFKKKS